MPAHRPPALAVWPPLRRAAIALAIVAAAACATRTTSNEGRAPALDRGFGVSTLSVTTVSSEARRLFDQGVLQAYAFNEREAVRAFKAALAVDPACALCAWGVAWQLGPNINAPRRGWLGEARRHAALAQSLAAGATAAERALIDAMALRYGADEPDASTPATDDVRGGAESLCGPANGERAHPRDIAYAQRLHELVQAEPTDPDLLSLWAEAELVATRDDWWDRASGRPAGRLGELASRLEAGLAAHAQHTGLNHYLIHVLDGSPEPARANAAAQRLPQLAPASPHLLHMPAHILARTGRLGDAVRANQAALDAEQRLAAALRSQGFSRSRDWDDHNLHFLWFAALADGQGEVALDAARRLAARAGRMNGRWGDYVRGLPALTLVRLERSAEVIALPPPIAPSPLADGIDAQARGVALARSGRIDEAAQQGQRFAAALAAASGDDVLALMRPLDARLRAELAAANGDAVAAAAAFADAAALDAQLDRREPPPLGAAGRLALASWQLRSGDRAGAAQTYRDDLAAWPGNADALRGLAAAR
ncbi:hypothetical protein [Caldimonas sp. KR1-144]|uniref:hypothetical protein n=1 Tax=Caldimonas sp. KR1-144 TaxID=3400911 RepID=UPI003C08CA96